MLIASCLEIEYDSEFFLCLAHVTRQKTSFSISLPSVKLTISHSTYKHDAMQDTMHDACHMNFVIDLTHCRVSLAQW